MPNELARSAHYRVFCQIIVNPIRFIGVLRPGLGQHILSINKHRYPSFATRPSVQMDDAAAAAGPAPADDLKETIFVSFVGGSCVYRKVIDKTSREISVERMPVSRFLSLQPYNDIIRNNLFIKGRLEHATPRTEGKHSPSKEMAGKHALPKIPADVLNMIESMPGVFLPISAMQFGFWVLSGKPIEYGFDPVSMGTERISPKIDPKEIIKTYTGPNTIEYPFLGGTKMYVKINRIGLSHYLNIYLPMNQNQSEYHYNINMTLARQYPDNPIHYIKSVEIRFITTSGISVTPVTSNGKIIGKSINFSQGQFIHYKKKWIHQLQNINMFWPTKNGFAQIHYKIFAYHMFNNCRMHYNHYINQKHTRFGDRFVIPLLDDPVPVKDTFLPIEYFQKRFIVLDAEENPVLREFGRRSKHEFQPDLFFDFWGTKPGSITIEKYPVRPGKLYDVTWEIIENTITTTHFDRDVPNTPIKNGDLRSFEFRTEIRHSIHVPARTVDGVRYDAHEYHQTAKFVCTVYPSRTFPIPAGNGRAATLFPPIPDSSELDAKLYIMRDAENRQHSLDFHASFIMTKENIAGKYPIGQFLINLLHHYVANTIG